MSCRETETWSVLSEISTFQVANKIRTKPHIVKSTDGNLFRNPGCIKTVLYSKLQSLLIENIIMSTLVENRRRVVQAVKYVIQRRAEQIYLQYHARVHDARLLFRSAIILPLKLKRRSSISCMLSSSFVHSYLEIFKLWREFATRQN